MKSIRGKLFLQIGFLVSFMFIMLLLVNTWLSEPYYMYTQQQQMIEYYEQIKIMDIGELSEPSNFLSNIEQSSGIEILLLDKDNNLIYASEAYKNDDRVTNVLQESLPHLTIETIKFLDDGTSLSKTTEDNFGIEKLLLSNQLDNGIIIELRLTVHYIQTAIHTINKILLFSGAVFIVISMLFAFLLSNSFTKPILNINEATTKMQDLDFAIHCNVATNDELGQLSDNINHMSDVLSDTINTLHIRDEKRRALLNNVSHELKTPLTLMQGYAMGLKRNVVTNPSKSEFYTEVIIDETIKMNRLVETLLDIDQLENDKHHLNLRVFDINPFVEENLKKFETLMEEKDIQYNVTYCKPTKIKCDPDLTEQVIKNLLSNAIHYIGEPPIIDISIQSNKNTVQVRITNTSEPIDSTELLKLWERFYKLDKARTRERGGHGLGLSIVKAIQDAHNQKCGVEIVDDKICFWFDVEINKD